MSDTINVKLPGTVVNLTVPGISSTQWQSVASEIRVTETSETRITEDGETRVLDYDTYSYPEITAVAFKNPIITIVLPEDVNPFVHKGTRFK